MKKFNLPAALALLLSIAGCGSIGNLHTYTGDGIIYTHRVVPLTFNPHPTDIVNDSNEGDRKMIQFQYVTVTWDYNALGDIAKKGGITKLYYADLEYRSVFFGTWSRYIVHLYGTR
jgi:L-aminopeptidase/D-esterase-like protein